MGESLFLRRSANFSLDTLSCHPLPGAAQAGRVPRQPPPRNRAKPGLPGRSLPPPAAAASSSAPEFPPTAGRRRRRPPFASRLRCHVGKTNAPAGARPHLHSPDKRAAAAAFLRLGTMKMHFSIPLSEELLEKFGGRYVVK